MTELGGGDEPVLVLVEDPEGLLQLLLRVGVLHLPRHQIQKLWKVDRPNKTLSMADLSKQLMKRTDTTILRTHDCTRRNIHPQNL
ncbi:unnamed protein product [Spirodela intermedia]|uniref:Uncharacterized protein n=1 Tax=Spirodela intermedia TaxID=51605 RepID=A0A7I8K5Z6_SPIIN|nr:unnamed protein product [Spirodela intermedia]